MQRDRRAEDNSWRQQQREADQCKHNLIHAYIGQSLIVAASDSVATLISWLIYDCSNMVEQRMIPGGSNNETDFTVAK